MRSEALFIVLALIWMWPAVVSIRALIKIHKFKRTYRRALVLTIAIGSIGAAAMSILGVLYVMTFEQRMVGWIAVDFFMASGLVGALRFLRDRPAERETMNKLGVKGGTT